MGNSNLTSDMKSGKYRMVNDSKTGKPFFSINTQLVAIPQKKKKVILKKKPTVKNNNYQIPVDGEYSLSTDYIEANINDEEIIKIEPVVNSNPYNKKIRNYSRANYPDNQTYQEQLDLQKLYLESPIQDEEEFLKTQNKFAMGGKVKKRKSYDYGGNIDLSQYQNIDYIDNPAELIAQNNINFAKAKAQVAANPLIQGGKMLGKIATGVGSKMVSGALGDMANEGKLGKVGGFLGKQSDTLIPLGLQGLDMFGKNQNMNSFAFGGKVPVEVEGDEAFELPNGKAGMFKGPSHEEGGIDVDLPEGTDIFSDRISIDGKTMAERKAGRERKLKSFTKRLDKNSSDQILKNTVSRIEQSNSLQEEEDKQIQEMINMVKQGPRKKFGNGGGVFKNYVGPNTNEEEGLITKRMFPFDNMEDILESERLTHNDKLKRKALSFVPQKWNPATNAFENDLTPDLEDIELNVAPETTNYANTVINPNADKISTQPNTLKSGFQDISLDGVGDFLAMSGDIGQSYLPYLNTLNQRANDTPNINPNKNVGIDSVETIQDSKGYVKQLRDKALTDLELSRTAQTKRGRNSARGVNTQRALDLATLQIANKGQNDIYDDSVKQMLAIVNQEADAKMQRDVYFAAGEKDRDMNDRKDRDAFYTQHGANLRNLGQSISKTGKNLNKIKENKDKEDILNQFFDNFEFDFSTGKVKAKTKSK